MLNSKNSSRMQNSKCSLSNTHNDRNYQFRIIVLGNNNVGKTSLIRRYCFDKFEIEHQPSIGIDFLLKNIAKQEAINPFNENIKLSIWDMAGQAEFRSFCRNFVQRADGVIFVCEYGNLQSLSDIEEWKKLVEENCRQVQGNSIPMVLAMNKSDKLIQSSDILDQQNPTTINNQDTKQLKRKDTFYRKFAKIAQQNGFDMQISISVLQNTNIDKLFATMLYLLKQKHTIDNMDTQYYQEQSSIQLSNRVNKKSNKDCC